MARPDRVLHVAERAAWERVAASGADWTGSTRGADLAQVGFVHCCTPEQLPGVLERFYDGADLDAHVLLVVDVVACEASGTPVLWEAPPGVTEHFPHLHGPLPAAAVVDVLPVPTAPTAPTG